MGDRDGRDVIEILLIVLAVIFVARWGFDKPAQAVSLQRPHTASTIWIDNSATPRWAVDRISRAWSDGSEVTFRYGTCPTEAPCILVSDGMLLPTATGEDVDLSIVRQEYRGQSRALVKLNNGKLLSANARGGVVCRAVGRALGLEPREGNDTCMSEVPNGRTLPTKSDLAAVNALY